MEDLNHVETQLPWEDIPDLGVVNVRCSHGLFIGCDRAQVCRRLIDECQSVNEC